MQPADEFTCSRALGSIASSLDKAERARALRLARGLGDPGARARSLAVLSRALPEAERPALLEEALASARSIGDPWRRVRALTPVAIRLPSEAREPIAREALLAAESIRGDWLRGRALGLLSGFSAGEVRARAIADALALEAPNERASALSAYAQDLPSPEIERLLAFAETLDDDWLVQTLIISLAGRLSPEQSPRAHSIARRIQGVARALALQALAKASRGEARSLNEEALASARALKQPSDRAETLTALLEELPPELGAAAASDALEAVRDVEDPTVRAMLLADLVPNVAQAERAQACADGLACARRIEDPFLRAERLSAFVPHLPRGEAALVIDEILTLFESRE